MNRLALGFALSFGLAFGIGFVFDFGSARADSPGPFGVGLVLGQPTGLSFNYKRSTERSVDAALAWNFSSNTGLQVHSDYLWHRPNVFRVESVPFNLHYGIGGRLLMANSKNNESAKTHFGPRLPVGINTGFNQKAIEAFAELALIVNLIPGTTADFDIGIGARVYF